MVNTSQKHNLKKALTGISGRTLHSPKNSEWKFYNNNFARAGQFEHKWPFIDIYFFEDNGTHINDVTPNWRNKYFDPKSDILPLEEGIFEGMVFPVPRNMEGYLKRRYKMDGECESTWWNHKNESMRKSVRIPCHLSSLVFIHSCISFELAIPHLKN